MSLNWREIDLVLDELSLLGARVQRIAQPRFSQLRLELYRRREALTLLIAMEQGKTRLHRTVAGFSKPGTPQRFQQLLQARLRGGAITEIKHVHRDRIIRFGISRAGEQYQLWARLWGGSANVILTDDEGTIIDAMYRRPKRGEVSGSVFSPPPPDAEAAQKAEALEVRPFLIQPASTGDGRYPVSAAIEARYATLEHEEHLARLRRDADKALASREAALRRRFEELQRRSSEGEQSERYKVIADAIMTGLHRVDPGTGWLKVENPYDPSEVLEIQLDPTLSGSDNAERYYRRYKKARASHEATEHELSETTAALERVRTRRQRVQQLGDPNELAALIGTARKRRQRGASEDRAPAVPGLQFHSGKLQLYLGRTAMENDELLRRHVRGNDLWLHVRDRPGPYVFVKTPKGKSVPLETLLDAGNLALAYSKAKAEGRALIQYTQVKNLRRAKDGPKGRVIPYHEKTIEVELDQERLQRLRRPGDEESP